MLGFQVAFQKGQKASLAMRKVPVFSIKMNNCKAQHKSQYMYPHTHTRTHAHTCTHMHADRVHLRIFLNEQQSFVQSEFMMEVKVGDIELIQP
jgi:hypothetical protein